MQKFILISFFIAFPTVIFSQNENSSIYWIDSDGSSATLIVTPGGKSILADASWDREPYLDRILEVMKIAGVSQIDYLITSHFHDDHSGGVLPLSKAFPICEYIDHGDSIYKDTDQGRDNWNNYLAAVEHSIATVRFCGQATGKRTPVRPGDMLPLDDGSSLTIVASDKSVLTNPLMPTEYNQLCDNAITGLDPWIGRESTHGENARSIGYVFSVGDFQFLDTTDIVWNGLHNLACPLNLVGKIDLLQLPHHGIDVAPQLIHAIEPIASVSNGGATKGGSPEGYEVISSSPGIEGIWQLHRSINNDDQHNTESEKIANHSELGESGNWVKAIISSDGKSFQITNSRNDYSEVYISR
ncbi:MAG: MBL fold metallo-hydrolase [Pseudomonadota bacterium]|nr:MBL fold metallo-hydrolase [Pseudomonadota bacterium]